MWWQLLVIVTALLLGGYAWLIERYRTWFLQIKPFQPDDNNAPTTRFTVIIPARNEAANIRKCLPSILQQQYPQNLFEVIVINDHSTDATAAEVNKLKQQHGNLKLLQLEDLLKGEQLNSYKKKAIELAIGRATGNWIVATDADCLVSDQWLSTYASYITQHQPVFIAAPVQFINDKSFLSIFQCLDFLSLQGITAASVSQGFHSMCNGANLAYSKAAFIEAGGFTDIDNIASGDDMLLMHKIYRQQPQGVHYLLAKKAIVQTTPMPNWHSFINQRIRWASKATTYNDKRIFWVLAMVYATNVALVVLLMAGCWKHTLFISWILLILGKIMIEMRFMLPVATFYGNEKLLAWFGAMQPVHILYTVVSGWLGKFGSYQWKGRKVR